MKTTTVKKPKVLDALNSILGTNITRNVGPARSKRATKKSVIHHHKIGDRVTVKNTTLGGKIITEGTATITALEDRENTYKVKFDGETESYVRYVDPS